MPLRQRFPVYARPLPFVVGAVLFVVGLFQALAWTWDWSLQTGNLFLQILIPNRLVRFEGAHLAFFVMALVGAGVLGAFGFARRAAVEAQARVGTPWWRRATFRFYPVTFALGLFLTYFGIVFLFNATVAGDVVPGGAVLFVYLNYAGILHRALVSLIGLAVILAGLLCALVLAVQPGSVVGVPAAKPEERPRVPAPSRTTGARAPTRAASVASKPRARPASAERRSPTPRPSTSRTS